MIGFDSVKKCFFGLVATASTAATVKVASEVCQTALTYKKYCYERSNRYFATEHGFFIRHIVNALPTTCPAQAIALSAATLAAFALGYIAYKSLKRYRAVRVVSNAVSRPSTIPPGHKGLIQLLHSNFSVFSPADEHTKTPPRNLFDFLPPGWYEGDPPPDH